MYRVNITEDKPFMHMAAYLEFTDTLCGQES
jgi:hypothetical protein